MTNMISDGSELQALEQAGTPEAATRLRQLAEAAGDKETRKVAKRALYRLSQRGIFPETQEAVVAQTDTGKVSDRLRAYASAFDGAGNQLLFLVVPDPDGGNPTLIQTILNDTEGVTSVDGLRMKRKDLEDRIGRFLEQLEAGLALAEIEGDYGRWLLDQARAINRQRGVPTPRGFLAWFQRVGEPRHAYEAVPIYSHISAEEVIADTSLSHAPADFFMLPWFDAWFLALDEIVPWFGPWVNAGVSELELSDSVIRERQDRVLDEATPRLITPEARARYQRRLELSAYVLYRRGQEATARRTLYFAQVLASEALVEQIPFARIVVERTLLAAVEQAMVNWGDAPEVPTEPSVNGEGA